LHLEYFFDDHCGQCFNDWSFALQSLIIHRIVRICYDLFPICVCNGTPAGVPEMFADIANQALAKFT